MAVTAARSRSRLERLVLASHRHYAAARHPRSATVAEEPPVGTLADLEERRHCLVVTYRRDGTSVATPVWFGLERDRLYFRAEAASGKAKRVRANPAVLVAPCTMRGRPLGPPMAGVARIVEGDGARAGAEAAIQGAYGLGRRLYERWFTLPEGVYVEVRPVT